MQPPQRTPWVWILLLYPLAALGEGTPLTLKSALEYATLHSPNYEAAAKSESIRSLELTNAGSRFLPSLDITATQGLQNNVPIASSASFYAANPFAPWYSSVNLGLAEVLYDNGSSFIHYQSAQMQRQLALLNLKKARESLALSVASEFQKYSLARSLLVIRIEQEKILHQQYRDLSHQYLQGLKTKDDTLRIQTQLQRSEMNRLAAENSVALSSSELKKILGERESNGESISFAPLPVLKSFERWNGLQVRPLFENKIAEIQNQLNDSETRLARRKYWPQANLGAGLTYSNANYLNSNVPFSTQNQLSWNVLLTLQYNIWDWGIRKRDLSVAELNRDIKNDAVRQSLLELQSQLTSRAFQISA